jgi:nitroimidazol reductase NimA-like FMN-containing flavoprotein (pyridoxamine 5'-phosphate oxidase superfamily)
MAELKVKSNRTTPIHGMRGAKRWAYIARQKTVRLATLNEDGTIYLSPLWYVVKEQRIFLPLDAGSRHATNAQAGRALSAVIDSGDEYATVHGINMKGTLKPVDDGAVIEEIMTLVFDKYFYDGHPYAESYFQFGRAAGRRILELVPAKFNGWDMRETSLPTVPEARVLPSFVKDRILL